MEVSHSELSEEMEAMPEYLEERAAEETNWANQNKAVNTYHALFPSIISPSKPGLPDCLRRVESSHSNAASKEVCALQYIPCVWFFISLLYCLLLIGLRREQIMKMHQNDWLSMSFNGLSLTECRAIYALLPAFRKDQVKQLQFKSVSFTLQP